VIQRRLRLALVDLEAQQQAINGPIATADPALAVELQVRLLELSEGVLDRCSDSMGAVIGLFQRGVDALATLAAAAGKSCLSPEALVEHAAELLQDNSYGQFEGLIPALAPVLGEAGLLQLEEALTGRALRATPASWGDEGARAQATRPLVFQLDCGYAVSEYPVFSRIPSNPMPTREHASKDSAPEAGISEGMVAREQIIRMPAQLAQLLISQRRQRGLSQAALAQKAGGISQARLSALELNPGRFTLERLLLILAALDLELVVRPRRRSEPAAW